MKQQVWYGFLGGDGVVGASSNNGDVGFNNGGVHQEDVIEYLLEEEVYLGG